MAESKPSPAQIEALRDDVIEQATEACAEGGPHHEGLLSAVLRLLVAEGDAELAQDLAERAGFVPVGLALEPSHG